MFRTIHHQAATGGTLISKTLAAMNGVRLLSEVNPVGPFVGPIQFDPTSLVSQYCKRYGRQGDEFLFEYFCSQIDLLERLNRKGSYDLILRDHNHNEYMSKDLKANRTPMLKCLEYYNESREVDEEIKSVITVRHPMDSFLSCLEKGWTKKISENLDVYCERYYQFIKDFSHCNIYKYEDFCEQPNQVLVKICGDLEVDFDPNYAERFSSIRLTGDSGRTSAVIERKSRREIPDDYALEFEKSSSYSRLCELLGYSK